MTEKEKIEARIKNQLRNARRLLKKAQKAADLDDRDTVREVRARLSEIVEGAEKDIKHLQKIKKKKSLASKLKNNLTPKKKKSEGKKRK